MAAIDKTYVNNWNDLQTIINWAKSVGTVTDDYGNRLVPYAWLYWSAEMTEQEFTEQQTEAWEKAKARYDKNSKNFNQEDYDWEVKHYGSDFLDHPEYFYEVPVWNTSIIQDIYLIRCCPLEIIQNRLKQQYGKSYEQIKNRQSVYDNFERNGNGKDVKFTVRRKELRFTDDNLQWVVYINSDDHWKFYCDSKTWIYDFEQHEGKRNDSPYDDFFTVGKMTNRKIYRLLRRWNLPSGTELIFRGLYKYHLKKFLVVKIK